MIIWSAYIEQSRETSGLESPRTRLPNSGWPPGWFPNLGWLPQGTYLFYRYLILDLHIFRVMKIVNSAWKKLSLVWGTWENTMFNL